MTAYVLEQLQSSLSRDLLAFAPELILCGAIVLMLLMRLFRYFDVQHMAWVAGPLTVVALYVTYMQWLGMKGYDPTYEFTILGQPFTLDVFSGMLVYDRFALFVKLFLFGFTALVIVLSMLTGIPDREDSADFYTLLLGATVGMSIMASSNHLLMVFLGIEMASLPSYALSGFLKGRRQSSEAALKYVVYGGGAAGIMLYGMSLLAGKYGTGYMPDLLSFMANGPLDPLVLLGSLFVLIGIGFKLAAVPFHFWCPDVFEGAAAEVGAFLSVASKGAALALLGRFTLGLGGLTQGAVDLDAWVKVAGVLVPAVAVFAAVTMTFGNLAAYTQNNLKRLLAYSTIAHAGFMMMGFATLTREGAGAVLFYLVVYLFMNLGAFAVVAVLRNLTGSEDLRDFRGLAYRSPLLVVVMGVFLLSLLGIPPLGGFAAKFQIFTALFDGAEKFTAAGQSGLAAWMYALVVIGGLNTVVSLFYYMRVLKVMAVDKPLEMVENRPVAGMTVPEAPGMYLALVAAAVLALGIFWDALSGAASDQGVSNFLEAPTKTMAKGANP